MFNAASGWPEGKLAIESAGQFRLAREDTTHERTSGSVVKGPKDDPTDALRLALIKNWVTDNPSDKIYQLLTSFIASRSAATHLAIQLLTKRITGGVIDHRLACMAANTNFASLVRQSFTRYMMYYGDGMASYARKSANPVMVFQEHRALVTAIESTVESMTNGVAGDRRHLVILTPGCMGCCCVGAHKGKQSLVCWRRPILRYFHRITPPLFTKVARQCF